MSELIRREDAIKATWQEPSYTDPLNVLTEVRDRINAIPAASPWHRVEEEPKENGRYFVSWEGAVAPDEYKNGVWLYASMFNLRITHWMPLPEPPKE